MMMMMMMMMMLMLTTTGRALASASNQEIDEQHITTTMTAIHTFLLILILFHIQLRNHDGFSNRGDGHCRMDDRPHDFPGHWRCQHPAGRNTHTEPLPERIDVVEVAVAGQDSVALVDGLARYGTHQVPCQTAPDLQHLLPNVLDQSGAEGCDTQGPGEHDSIPIPIPIPIPMPIPMPSLHSLAAGATSGCLMHSCL
jgi:hypothetical protein